MKITYRHARRHKTPIPPGPLPGLPALEKHMRQLNRLQDALTHLTNLGIPVPNNTRARCQAVTICELSPEDGEFFEPVVGAAFCCNKDQFNRKIGRQIALGRAAATRNAAMKANIVTKVTEHD